MTEPSIWDLVVGHDEAVATLKEVVAGERVTHAWLFTGPGSASSTQPECSPPP
jgi:DNA polymerase III gamma/tau subunit